MFCPSQHFVAVEIFFETVFFHDFNFLPGRVPKVEATNSRGDISSHPDVLCKKRVLRNFAKFTGKHLCQSLSSNKVAGLRPAASEVTLIEGGKTFFIVWHDYFD